MRRRDLLKAGAIALPMAALPAVPALAQATIATPTDVLAYVLNLKYVQAELYRLGNAQGLLSGREADLLAQMAGHKQAHVAALTHALSTAGAPVPPSPALDFASVFGSRDSYLETAHMVEDAVVRGSLGIPAAPVQAGAEAAQFDVSGVFMLDARAAAVLGSILGKPVVGGILQAEPVTPLAPEEVLAVLRPYVAGPWAVAGTAAVTQ